MKPLHTLTADVSVGIYDNCERVARVYADKIICVWPTVKWVGNTGGYYEEKRAIRTLSVVSRVITALNDGCEDDAWGIIEEYFA
jgi:hypothetical protein